jgi:hypothetical protein
MIPVQHRGGVITKVRSFLSAFYWGFSNISTPPIFSPCLVLFMTIVTHLALNSDVCFGALRTDERMEVMPLPIATLLRISWTVPSIVWNKAEGSLWGGSWRCWATRCSASKCVERLVIDVNPQRKLEVPYKYRTIWQTYHFGWSTCTWIKATQKLTQILDAHVPWGSLFFQEITITAVLLYLVEQDRVFLWKQLGT